MLRSSCPLSARRFPPFIPLALTRARASERPFASVACTFAVLPSPQLLPRIPPPGPTAPGMARAPPCLFGRAPSLDPARRSSRSFLSLAPSRAARFVSPPFQSRFPTLVRAALLSLLLPLPGRPCSTEFWLGGPSLPDGGSPSSSPLRLPVSLVVPPFPSVHPLLAGSRRACVRLVSSGGRGTTRCRCHLYGTAESRQNREGVVGSDAEPPREKERWRGRKRWAFVSVRERGERMTACRFARAKRGEDGGREESGVCPSAFRGRGCSRCEEPFRK